MSITSQSSKAIFSGNNIATTGFIYNSSSGATATAGWLDCRSDHTVVQTCVATLTRSGNCIYRIEGKFDSLDRAASLDVGVLAAVNTIDKIYEISEHIKYIRVGVRATIAPASPLASPCNFYAGVCLTDVK